MACATGRRMPPPGCGRAAHKCMAIVMATNIRVNAICPSFVETDLTAAVPSKAPIRMPCGANESGASRDASGNPKIWPGRYIWPATNRQVTGTHSRGWRIFGGVGKQYLAFGTGTPAPLFCGLPNAKCRWWLRADSRSSRIILRDAPTPPRLRQQQQPPSPQPLPGVALLSPWVWQRRGQDHARNNLAIVLEAGTKVIPRRRRLRPNVPLMLGISAQPKVLAGTIALNSSSSRPQGDLGRVLESRRQASSGAVPAAFIIKQFLGSVVWEVDHRRGFASGHETWRCR
jgi:hypothetical protein